jgi:hypothetical protein
VNDIRLIAMQRERPRARVLILVLDLHTLLSVVLREVTTSSR